MPTPRFSWSIVEDVYAIPVYNEARVRELFVSVGPPPDARDKLEVTAFRLNEMVKAFAFDLWHELQPTSEKAEVESRKLALALLSALQIVGCGDGEPVLENLHPWFSTGGLFAAAALRGEPSGKGATMNALRAVYLLRQDALKLAEVQSSRARMKPKKRGRPALRAMPRLVARLAELYFDIWTEAPTVARHRSGETDSPFVRLMLNVAGAMKARGVNFAFSADSLAKQWERLPADQQMRPDRMEKTA